MIIGGTLYHAVEETSGSYEDEVDIFHANAALILFYRI